MLHDKLAALYLTKFVHERDSLRETQLLNISFQNALIGKKQLFLPNYLNRVHFFVDLLQALIIWATIWIELNLVIVYMIVMVLDQELLALYPAHSLAEEGEHCDLQTLDDMNVVATSWIRKARIITFTTVLMLMA